MKPTKSGEFEDSSNDRLLVIQGKLAECRSVDQVINAVYSDYRPSFKEHLLSYSSWCEKLETVRSSLERLKRSLEEQTIPPRLHVKAPEFQFTKEFGELTSNAASAARNAFSTATATFQEAINAASLAGKKAEVAFWEEMCDLPILLEKLSDIIAIVWNDREKSFRVPKIIYDAAGKADIGEWVVFPQKIIERDTLIRASPLFGVRIGEIVALRHRSMAAKIQKKKEVSANADVEMTDATKPGPSIQLLIDKGLNARLKKLNLVPGKKVNTQSYPHSTTLANDCSNYSELVWPREKGNETQVRPLFIEGSSKGKTKVYGYVEEKQ